MESGVLDKGDIQKVQGRGASRTGLGTTGLGMRMCSDSLQSHVASHAKYSTFSGFCGSV